MKRYIDFLQRGVFRWCRSFFLNIKFHLRMTSCCFFVVVVVVDLFLFVLLLLFFIFFIYIYFFNSLYLIENSATNCSKNMYLLAKL